MQCYNIGCSKKFEINENTENSCRYHPLQPVFHDGKKGWDCCKRFSTDFSTCLSMPGCKVGYHNSQKPVEPEKKKIDPKFDVDVVVVTNPIEQKPERPTGDDEMLVLSVSEHPNLRTDLEKRRNEMALNKQPSAESESDEVPLNTSCKNAGCKRSFSGQETNKEVCVYHNGVAIFHEGLKYWTCCQRKTTDWDSFLAQEGCTTGCHLWFKNVLNVECRYDWFQTGPYVTISFYAKHAVPETIAAKANSVKLSVEFDFDCGSSKYEVFFDLLEEIDPRQSTVKVNSTKVEVVLKKKMMYNWSSLQIRK